MGAKFGRARSDSGHALRQGAPQRSSLRLGSRPVNETLPPYLRGHTLSTARKGEGSTIYCKREGPMHVMEVKDKYCIIAVRHIGTSVRTWSEPEQQLHFRETFRRQCHLTPFANRVFTSLTVRLLAHFEWRIQHQLTSRSLFWIRAWLQRSTDFQRSLRLIYGAGDPSQENAWNWRVLMASLLDNKIHGIFNSLRVRERRNCPSLCT